MSDDFFDSNVLVYMFDWRDDHKRTTARQIVAEAVPRRTAVISFQVVQETLNVITQKIPEPITATDARVVLEQVLEPLWRVYPTDGLYREALRIQERYGYHFYDALIVAAAREAGCSRLLSEDLHDGQEIEGLTIVNPFAN